ncbi:5891_t:CDS:1, partial [Racocetra persica]
ILSEDSDASNIITSQKSVLNKKLKFYKKKATVLNMERATKNWMDKFEEFRRNYNYVTLINSIADPRLIECQVYEYIVQMTKKDGEEYKAKSIQQAVDRINRYLVKYGFIQGLNLHDKYQFPNLYDVVNGKMKDLQEKGLGEKEGSVALTAQQVKDILDDEFLDPNTPEGLLYQGFFRNLMIFACRGNKHCALQINQFQIQADDSILFCHYHSKNNQRKILRGSAQNIHMPPDLPGTSGPVSDIKKYISKRSSDASSNFYLHPNQDWQVTGIWYHKKHCGINKVQNFIKDIGNKVK